MEGRGAGHGVVEDESQLGAVVVADAVACRQDQVGRDERRAAEAGDQLIGEPLGRADAEALEGDGRETHVVRVGFVDVGDRDHRGREAGCLAGPGLVGECEDVLAVVGAVDDRLLDRGRRLREVRAPGGRGQRDRRSRRGRRGRRDGAE